MLLEDLSKHQRETLLNRYYVRKCNLKKALSFEEKKGRVQNLKKQLDEIKEKRDKYDAIFQTNRAQIENLYKCNAILEAEIEK